MNSYSELVKNLLTIYGFESVESLINSKEHISNKQDFIYDLVIEAQRECLKKAYDNAEIKEDPYIGEISVSKDSIINENNIIK